MGVGDNSLVEHMLSTRQALGSALSAKSDSKETAASFVSQRWRSRAPWFPALPRGETFPATVQFRVAIVPHGPGLAYDFKTKKMRTWWPET